MLKDLWDLAVSLFEQTGSPVLVIFSVVTVLAYAYIANYNNPDECRKIYDRLTDPLQERETGRRRFPFRFFYKRALGRVLGWLDVRFNPEGEYKGAGDLRHAAGWRLYDKCLLVSFIYPLFFVVLLWVWQVESASFISYPLVASADLTLWKRYTILVVSIAPFVFAFYIPATLAWFQRAFTGPRTWLRLPEIPAFALAVFIILGVAAFITYYVVNAVAIATADAVTVANVGKSSFILTYAFAVTGAVAIAITGSTAGTFAFSSAYVFIFVCTLVLAFIFAGGFAIVFVLPVAFVFIFAFVFVLFGSRRFAWMIAFTVNGIYLMYIAVVLLTAGVSAFGTGFSLLGLTFLVFGFLYKRDALSVKRPLQACLLLITIVTLGVMVSIAGGYVDASSYSVILFLILLPLTNAQFDFLSMTATRYFLRRGVDGRWNEQIIWGLADLCIGLLCFTGLCLTAVAVIHGLNLLAPEGPLFNLSAVFADPPGHIWLLAAFLTTLLPTFVHLVLVIASIAVAWPYRIRMWCAVRLYRFHVEGSDPGGARQARFVVALLAGASTTLSLGIFMVIWNALDHAGWAGDRLIAVMSGWYQMLGGVI